MRVLVLPEELRDELKEPLGVLYRCHGVECVERMSDHLRAAERVIAVGDITTFYLLKASFIPDLMIVDHKTKRSPVEDSIKRRHLEGSYRVVNVENPAGTLTEELLDAVRESLNGCTPTEIIVDGEEDLAALPAILYAPLGSAVVYGQPSVGSVLVMVTPEKKREIEGILRRMTVKEKV
ncbi:MAG: GTP-dependent dephospho-CoA kinase family protein [Methanothrix sp.]|uniref:GTP-dependent dephospho-CoA kinase n=1 Tax=Methanothrix thermoacetophila (strain DSM 6194 / JCM 14653 / NBRC 101360 / PT) TaxID=349307 RepID=DPCKG_METTP|nr:MULTISPECIES: GTP-dependent dephospho-CoA kinase family protein [Methanothrix]A0B8S7.1 RecName: Full=GTP-dependent dephospho-CoA kinase; AltName: Full=Dephospho-coenzyme A kinase; Short=DPCK [Methanothrix thermoacetophila PT]ABK15101.1 Protein of unknown function DUF359 [Methanothrix thermoacetophila PT]MBC7079316.1 GTP-dependent dephospho-CoA kinase family protein [Methanothrix sp.]NPU86782.1 GTP-dependent dephospho-CoA kinase family protein [Methanothrix sp.]